MAEIEQSEKLKTVPDILFFALNQYHEMKKDIARLNRIIEYKQSKIETLKLQVDGNILAN